MILLLRYLPLKKTIDPSFFRNLIRVILAAFLLFESAVWPVSAMTPVDGTFLLRSRKSELDQQLRQKLNIDEHFKNFLKASSFPGEMIVGETETGFQVYNFAASTYEYRRGLLVAQGKFCNLYIEAGLENSFSDESKTKFSQIIDNFDNKVYPSVTGWFGKPVIPEDFAWPDQKINIFLVDIRDKFENGYVAGYFDHRDLEGLLGNQKAVFFMDLNPGEPGDPADKNNSFYRTLAHEFQHMVNFSIRNARGLAEQERWLDEGLAMFSEYMFSEEIGSSRERIPPTPHFERFLENPAVNITSDSKESWFREDKLFRQYGASFAFVVYLVEKYGGSTRAMQQAFMREFIGTPDAGVKGINNFFAHLNIDFAQIFSAFILSLHLDKAAVPNPWGFNSLNDSFGNSSGALPLRMIRHYAASDSGSFIGSDNQVLANSICIEEIAGKDKVTIAIECSIPVSVYLAELLPDNSGLVRKIPLVAGRGSVNADFSDGRRMFLLPLALSEDYNADDSFKYSFKSQSDNLILYPFPNPAFEDQFMIFLKSQKGPLSSEPVLRVSFGNLLDSPRFSSVDDSKTLFIAHYQIPGEGRGQAFCFHEDDSCSFSFSAVRTGSGQTAMTADSSIKLLVSSEKNGLAAVSLPDAALTSLPTGMIAGPFDLFFPDQATASVILTSDYCEKDGICRPGTDGKIAEWLPLRQRGSELVAELAAAGRYYVGRDAVSPVIRDFSLYRIDNDLFMRIDADDDFSGINRQSLKVFVENRIVDLVDKENFTRIPLGDSIKISGNVEAEISDFAGNSARARLSAASAVTSRQIRLDIFPNPCRKSSEFSLIFRDNPVVYEAFASIYDVSGHQICRLELQNAGAGKNSARWNLSDGSGRIVSNGVYLVKVKARTSQGELRTTGKVAVLR